MIMNLIRTAYVLPKLWPISLFKNSLKLTTLNKPTYILPKSAYTTLRLCNDYNLLKIQSQAFCNYTQTPHKSNRHLDWVEKNVEDIPLFINEDSKYYKGVLFFGITQFVLWVYSSYLLVTAVSDDFVTEEEIQAAKESFLTDNPRIISLVRQLNLGKYKYLIGATGALLGVSILCASSVLARRSVKFLMIRKGGIEVTFEFFTFSGKSRFKTLPLKNVSAQNSRQSSRNYLVLKFRNHLFYYILDLNNGKFQNPEIFDKTVGLQRRFK